MNKIKKLNFKNPKLFILIICILMCMAIGLFSLWYYVNSLPKTHTITLTKNGYSPSNVTIRQNDTVVFQNKTEMQFWPASNLHPSHSIFSEFDPKKHLENDEMWSFTFTKSGRWRYHDHLFPNFTGTIIVLDENGKIPAVVDSCERVEDAEKQRCWDEELAATIEHGSLEEAFELFLAIYNTSPDIPKACHGWAHILGKEAYNLYKKEKKVVLRPEISYCGYGFMHGFIEQLVLETGDPKKTREFCLYAQEQLKDQGDVYTNCLHGIGHGSVDVEDESKWGNFQAMIDPGIERCESILSDPSELRQCYDGVFNAMHQYEFNNEYKLTFDADDLYKHCRVQKEAVKTACYFEYVGLSSYSSGHNFRVAVRKLLAEDIPDTIAFIAINKMASDFMQDDIVNSDWEKNVSDCRILHTKYYDSCMRGILGGFIAHGLPGREFVKGLEYCEAPYLTDADKDLCYSYFLPSVSKNSSECRAVDQKFRHYCKV